LPPVDPPSPEMGLFMPVPSIYGFGKFNLKSTSADSILTDSIFTIEELTFDPLPDSMKTKLVLYYPFDNGPVDESPMALNSELDGSGEAFNEGNNLINVDHDPALNFDSTFTIGVWMNNNGLIANLAQNIVSKWKRVSDDFNNVGYALEYRSDTDGIVMLEFHNVFDVDTNMRASYSCQYWDQNLKFGWHFIVISFDGINIKMFVDDVEVCNSENGFETESGNTGVYYSGIYSSNNEETFNKQLVNNKENVYIGGENTDEWLDHYFLGSLDNLTLFNRNLSTEEIHELFNLRVQ